MSQSAYSEETKNIVEIEKPIAIIIAKLPEYSQVVEENTCVPSLKYHKQSQKWEIGYDVQGNQDPIIGFLDRMNNLNISGIVIDTSTKKILADNISDVQKLIEAYIQTNPDHIPTEEVDALNGVYKDALSGVDEGKKTRSENDISLIHMVAQLPLHQIVAGRFSVGFRETSDGIHQIIYTPESGEAKDEIELFLSRIEPLKIEGISSNGLTLSATNIGSLERLVENYIEHDPVQVGREKIAEITNAYLAYKSDQLEEIKDDLTTQHNGDPSVLDFEAYTPYPRSTYAIYRGFEAVLAHYGSQVDNLSDPENILSIAWNITEDESNFFIFVDAIEGEPVNPLKKRAKALTGQLINLAESTVEMTCVYLEEQHQCRIQISSANIVDIKNIVKSYYNAAQISENPKTDEVFSYLKTSFLLGDTQNILPAETLLALPAKPIITAKGLDITPQPITINEIESIMTSEIRHDLVDNSNPVYNPQFNAH